MSLPLPVAFARCGYAMSDTAFAIAVLVMLVATLATRLAGAVLMSKIKPTMRTERFLEGLSASVIAALVASQLVTADVKHTIAVIVAVLLAMFTGNVVWAMLAGMIVAAMFPIVTGL